MNNIPFKRNHYRYLLIVNVNPENNPQNSN